MAERDEHQQSSGCSACEQLGQMPTQEHLAGVARFEARQQAATKVESLEAENARLRERVAALEERTEAAEGRVLALADALADVVLLIHEKGHSGMPSRCERGVCVTGWQLVAAVRESAVDSLAADFAAALAGQETAGGAS